MSTYTVYLSKIEAALGTLVNDIVNKQKIAHPYLCSTRTKGRILSMFVDMFPLLYNCDCVSESQLNQIQNLIIKLTATPSIGLIDQNDLSCGGIQTQIVHSTSESGSGVIASQQCGSINLSAGVIATIVFGQNLGTSGNDWVFMGTPFCYNGEGIIAFSITSRTANGFKVESIEDATFTYCAIKK